MKAFLLLFLLASSPAFAGYLGIDYTEKGGKVVLTKIDRKSPAEYYGLKVGDIVVSGMSPDAFIASIKRAKPGTILSFQVRTKTGQETVHIPVSAGPGAPFARNVIQAD
jgi:predicted metalloprotease with PDZ domain